MKKRVIIVALILIALFACLYFSTSQAPKIKITQENVKIDVLKLPISWKTLLSGFKANYPTPTELAKVLTATTVKQQSIINFSFSKKPKFYDVYVWNGSSEKYQSNSNGIVAPNEKGTHVFTVIGRWYNGDVLYVFKINVE